MKIVYRIEVENEPYVFGTSDQIFDYLSGFNENLKVFICPGVDDLVILCMIIIMIVIGRPTLPAIITLPKR